MGLVAAAASCDEWLGHSSADVSIGYLLILLRGFALWVAYGFNPQAQAQARVLRTVD
jgi:hypothetical protein